MNIIAFQLGPLSTNGYLLQQGGEAVFIDPGGDPASVVDMLKEQEIDLTHILITHMHFDHIFGSKALSEATGAEILASETDEQLLATEVGGGGFMGFPKVPTFSYTSIGAGKFTVLGMTCEARASPGHTPGSLSFYFPDAGAVFVGDVVFQRSIGRTDFPGGDHETLLTSIEMEILTLPAETVIYSGHGEPTTVGEEALHNPFLRNRSF